MKRSISFLTILFMVTLLFSGCQSTSVTPKESLSENDLSELLMDLMPQAQDLITIFHGEGLEADLSATPITTATEQKFYPVKDSPYTSVQELKNAVEQVFTKEYAQKRFYQYALEGDTIRYKDINSKLYIDINQVGAEYEQYSVGSLAILETLPDGFLISMDYTTMNGDTGTSKLILKTSGNQILIDNIEKLTD